MTGRCVDLACQDGPRDDDDTPAPRWATVGLLCKRDADTLERRLAELPARHAQVRTMLGGIQAAGSSESKRTKGAPPVPLNLTAHDHLEAMQATVTSWVREVCERRRLRGPDGSDLGKLTSWLLSQLDYIVDQEWVRELADEVRDLSRTADRITGARPGWHVLPAPCPGCDSPTLGRWDGADEVACGTCGERWPEGDYRRLVAVLASDTTTSLSADDAARRAGVQPATFRQWVSRGKVRRIGTAHGQARYSTADVDAVREDGAA